VAALILYKAANLFSTVSWSWQSDSAGNKEYEIRNEGVGPLNPLEADLFVLGAMNRAPTGHSAFNNAETNVSSHFPGSPLHCTSDTIKKARRDINLCVAPYLLPSAAGRILLFTFGRRPNFTSCPQDRILPPRSARRLTSPPQKDYNGIVIRCSDGGC